MFGPDAFAITGGAVAGIFAYWKSEVGAISVLRGKDAGHIMHNIEDVGFGLTSLSIGANIGITKLYYSGGTNFYKDVFLGDRFEVNVSVGELYGIGFTGVYAPLTNGNFVL